MSILMIIIYCICGIIALFLIAGLLAKKDFSISRSIIIDKPKASVFDYIKYLKNQNDYSKWAQMDPDMKKTFTGTDATPGFISAWEGNKKVGAGEQEIRAVKEGERVDYNLHFIKPWESRATSYMSTEAEGSSATKVTWGLQFSMKFPMNAMGLFMNMNKTMGNDLDIGLNNLKTKLEN